MKRKWLWVWTGVLFLLGMFPSFVFLPLRRPGAADRAVLGPRAWVSAWCANLPLAWSRAGPRKSFAPHLEFLITTDVGPLWLDHRGPPGPRGCSRLRVSGCKAAGQRRGQAGHLPPEFLAPQRANPKLGVFQQPLASLPFLVLTRDPVVAITCTFWSWILNLVLVEWLIRRGSPVATAFKVPPLETN